VTPREMRHLSAFRECWFGPARGDTQLGVELAIRMERRISMSTLRHVSARSRWLLPMGAAAVVAVVVLAVIVVVSVVRGGNATTEPPVLHLTSGAVGSAGQ